MDENERLLIYLTTVCMVHKLYLTGEVDIEILKRLNEKNASDMGCRVVDFMKIK